LSFMVIVDCDNMLYCGGNATTGAVLFLELQYYDLVW
jgi:hypothetical protein